MNLVCQCEGCGHASFTVDDEEEAFYVSKALQWPPLNCPDCRAYKKSVTEMHISCIYCGADRRITKQHQISFNKNEGKFEPPEVCIACEKDPSRAEKILALANRQKTHLQRRKEKTNEDLLLLDELEQNGYQINVVGTSDQLNDDANHYQEMMTVDHDQNPETRAQHIANHNSDIAAHIGAQSLQDQLRYFAAMAASTDPAFKMQLTQSRGNKVILVDKSTSDKKALIVVIQHQPQYGSTNVITSFSVDATKLMRNLDTGFWAYHTDGV